MASGVDLNIYEDITVPVGCDMVWGFQLEPFDATGTSAVLMAGGNSYAAVVTVTTSGDDSQSAFQFHLTPTQLTALGLSVAGVAVPYTIRWTASDSTVQALGYGTILAQ